MADAQPIETVFDDQDQVIGEMYGKALLGALGPKAGTGVEQLESLVADVLTKLPAFDAALVSPSVPMDRKMEWIDRALRGKVDDVLLRFLKVVCRRGRFGSLRSIAASTRKIFDASQGRKAVTITTAAPLTEPQREQIRKGLKDRFQAEVVLEERVDPAILGGLLIRHGDTVLDGSVVGRLRSSQKNTVEKTEQTLRQQQSRLVR
jgi:F-type H+-transporting ATPase subunit delta